ncbi:MAG: PBP1A family penicillin-binding protein [Desulfohalobium sp.]
MPRFLKIALVVLALGLLIGAGGAVGVYYWAAKDLPDFKNITDYTPPLVTTVYSADKEVLGYFSEERRFLVPLGEIAPEVKHAFLAAEDSEFYSHEGVDLFGIMRAAWKNFQAGEIVQGGSTITQQVIKSMLLSSERSYQRKLKEAILAYRLEKNLEKDEILTIYLNEIYLGAGAYGVEAAARAYFGKHASELNLPEAALLAGLPKAPSAYNPLEHPQRARQRQRYVLQRMRDKDWLSQEGFERAVETELEFKSMTDPSWKVGSYYLEEVRRRLIERFGEETVYTGGLNVYTAVDLKHQRAAEKAVQDGLRASTKRRGWKGAADTLNATQADAFVQRQVLPEMADLREGAWFQAVVNEVDKEGAQVRFGSYSGRMDVSTMEWARTPDPDKAPEEVPAVKDARRVLSSGDLVWASAAGIPEDPKSPWELALEQQPEVQGSLVSMDPKNGTVKAMVGGYEFARSQFNRATQAKRQPGSAFKPIVYSAALDNGFTPATVLLDAPIVYNDQATNSTWKPENYEGVFHGPTLLRTALVKSRNLVTIRVAQKIGIDTIIQRAKALGLEANFPRDLSVSLGSASVTPLHLCRAFTAFARPKGDRVDPRMILRVEDPWGEELFAPEPKVEDALTPQTSYMVTNLLQQVVQSGTAWRVRSLGRPVAGKTGTTNDQRDAWFMGYSPALLTGVYVAFDQLEPMGKYETGSRAASPIWLDYRQAVRDEVPEEDFQRPPGIVMARIDAKTGKLAGPDTETSYFLPFKSGTQPQEVSPPRKPGGDANGDDSGGDGGDDDLLKQVF